MDLYHGNFKFDLGQVTQQKTIDSAGKVIFPVSFLVKGPGLIVL